ncbi:MAG: response regulator [Chitinophagaceae bacterium]|nr:MAG: response regulator [Chitinophagaceae bacterium]
MTPPLVFFLADDDEDDRMLFEEALAEVDKKIRCITVKNGREALDVLQNEMVLLPDYIFLDLNMPMLNGLQCLAELKKIELLQHIPVIIYSTSSDKDSMEESKRLGAIDFFVKPSNFTGLKNYLQKFAPH